MQKKYDSINFHCHLWLLLNKFIKLSDKSGEIFQDLSLPYIPAEELEKEIVSKYQHLFPRKHTIHGKSYLFEIKTINKELHFKTYEGEPHYDGHGKWIRYDSNFKH